MSVSLNMNQQKLQTLQAMGLGPVWQRRGLAQGFEHEQGASVQSEESLHHIAALDWQPLTEMIASCQQCGLCKGRKHTVPGVGDIQAKWLFVGEGPGRQEDEQGEPFVGPAGKLLDNMMVAMGLERGKNTYIANIVKCRPIGADGKDRPPTPAEAAACMPYLERQIALIQPDVIVALGKSAAVYLLNLNPSTAVSSMRGKIHQHQELPVVVTYHPAYLLRDPTQKKHVWQDLCLARSVMHELQ
jgi:uracil-DNA glycosylase